MRRTPASLYGFLLWMAIALVCLGVSVVERSGPFLLLWAVAIIIAFIELHKALS